MALLDSSRLHPSPVRLEKACGFPTLDMGDLAVAVMTRAEAAAFLNAAASKPRAVDRPSLYVTSANGEVLSRTARDPAIKALFAEADMIHADGQAMVIASRLRGGPALPERVATTDLLHDVARLAEDSGVSFYFLGGTDEVVREAVAAMQRTYPLLRIAGARHGYFEPGEEAAVVAEINRARPSILWVGMGVPREQAFAVRNRHKLTSVNVIKTSGGLFDFLSGHRSRAPGWMQTAGLEWLYRAMLEPRRLAMRYLTTSPHALLILLRKRH